MQLLRVVLSCSDQRAVVSRISREQVIQVVEVEGIDLKYIALAVD